MTKPIIVVKIPAVNYCVLLIFLALPDIKRFWSPITIATMLLLIGLALLYSQVVFV